MNGVIKLGNVFFDFFDRIKSIDFLAPLLLRLFLAPIFILAGYGKLVALEDTAYWFGEFLGLPAPMLMAFLGRVYRICWGHLLTFWLCCPLMGDTADVHYVYCRRNCALG